MITDQSLYQLAMDAGRRLSARAWTVVTAESCTGGWIAKALTDVPGSSAWMRGGIVAYSNDLKKTILGVGQLTLDEFGAVSKAVVREMAEGALAGAGADLALATSGIAGPDGGTLDKPVGLVWFALASRYAPMGAVRRFYAGDRESVRRQAVAEALRLIIASTLPGRTPATGAPAGPSSR